MYVDSVNRKKKENVSSSSSSSRALLQTNKKKNAVCVCVTRKTVEIGCYLKKNDEEDGGGRSNSRSRCSVCVGVSI